MSRKSGCCFGMISGCLMLLILTGAAAFFGYEFFKYQEAEAARAKITISRQLIRTWQKWKDSFL